MATLAELPFNGLGGFVAVSRGLLLKGRCGFPRTCRHQARL